ncbi:MAG: serine hydrolase [Desulfomonilaceae bacterium]|nr:serine hydrolase [Desulfomonilaceae bacterium]
MTKQPNMSASKRLTARGTVWARLTVIGVTLSLFAFFWPATPCLAERTSAPQRKVVKDTPKQKPHAKPGARKLHKKAQKRPSPGVEAKAVYCVDVKHKKILLARNADKRLPIASLSKLVTAMVTLDHMPLSRKVKVPQNINRVPKSVVGLLPGDVVTVRDLLHGLLMRSGNDCAETLASAYPGGRSAFIKAMNVKVRRLGAKHTVFYTPSGLDSKRALTKDGKKSVQVRSNVSTAREIARIARSAFSNKTIRSICGKKSYVIAGKKKKHGYRVTTTNKLLRTNLPVVVGKTGYTNRAGHCLASAFTPGKNLFLIVVLGSPDHFRDTRLVYRKALKKVREHDKASTRRVESNEPRPKLAFHRK